MSDLEFEVLDELYFVTSYKDLQDETGLSEVQLKGCLQNLLSRQWIKCFTSISEELPPDEVDFEKDYQSYFYLATKSGLLAHNQV